MRLPVQIREIPDEIRQQFHVACLVLVAADEAQFAGPVKPHLLRARQHVPGAIPRAALAGVEPVARGSRVGEGRVDMALTVEAQVMRPPREGQFAAVERGAALALRRSGGHWSRLRSRRGCRLLVAVDQPPQHRRLVMGLGNQPTRARSLTDVILKPRPAAHRHSPARAGSWAIPLRSSRPRAARRRTRDRGWAASPNPARSVR
jgi:hypothetical protein